MVTLNLTLLVELGLFLLFVWLVSRLIIAPTVRVMDERDAQLAGDEAQAQQDEEQAAALEKSYTQAIAAARYESSRLLAQARREALARRADAILERRRVEGEAVAAAHAEAVTALKAERPKYPELAAALAERMSEQLLGKGDRL